jgi:hypothetical protein
MALPPTTTIHQPQISLAQVNLLISPNQNPNTPIVCVVRPEPSRNTRQLKLYSPNQNDYDNIKAAIGKRMSMKQSGHPDFQETSHRRHYESIIGFFVYTYGKCIVSHPYKEKLTCYDSCQKANPNGFCQCGKCLQADHGKHSVIPKNIPTGPFSQFTRQNQKFCIDPNPTVHETNPLPDYFLTVFDAI